jgi:hypothetical protein
MLAHGRRTILHSSTLRAAVKMLHIHASFLLLKSFLYVEGTMNGISWQLLPRSWVPFEEVFFRDWSMRFDSSIAGARQACLG